jgi:hypothetical protein
MRILKISARKRKEKKSGTVVVVIDYNLLDCKDFKERRNWRG